MELVPGGILLQFSDFPFGLVGQIYINPTDRVSELLRIIAVEWVAMAFKNEGGEAQHTRLEVDGGIPHGHITLESKAGDILLVRAHPACVAESADREGVSLGGDGLGNLCETSKRAGELENGGIVLLHPLSAVSVVVIGIIQVVVGCVILIGAHRRDVLRAGCRGHANCQQA